MSRAAPIMLARAALVWERAAPVLAGPLAAFGIYVGLALYGAFEQFGDPLRLVVLAVLAAAGAWSARAGLLAFRWPDRRDAERRVEEDSGLAGRPYEALHDRPASGGEAMWEAHRARMLSRLARARASRPAAAWARLDPLGVRVWLVLVIVTGAFLAGDLAAPRAQDAFAPRLLAAGGAEAGVAFWVEPPAYTGRPVQYLRARRDAAIPEGSVVAARITGIRRDPVVSGASAEIETLSPGVRLLRFTPEQSGDVRIRSGALNERLTLTLIEDAPPRVALAAQPEGDAQGRLALEFIAEDDYGVEALVLEYAPEPDDGSVPAPGNFIERLLSPGELTGPGPDGLYSARIDLSRSPLAGERVVIRMAALDGAGQRGVSGPLALTLPQRIFLNPLARAVAAERKAFLGAEGAYAPMPGEAAAFLAGGFLDDEPERRLERAPAGVRRLAVALDAVSDAPPAYFTDAIVWAGLRTAMREVRRAREYDQLRHLDEDLWQIALRAELGSLADAEEALRAAEEALMDALARGADPIELSALFDAFERAMANYMQALAREAAESGAFAEGGGGAGGMNADALQELLDALREAAELGDSAGSRRALAQLAELLRNMQMMLGAGGGGDGESAMAQALREALEELSEAIGEQRSVMEDTFNENRRRQGAEGEENSAGAPAEGGGGAGLDALAERQRALRERLDGLERAIPGGDADQARRALDAAREAMEEAETALREGGGEEALGAQDEALSGLREASRAGSRAFEAMSAGENGGEARDPLGRGGGAAQGAETGLSGGAERQRAREILEELRRRASERGRPQEELDYIDRLLERFRRR